MIMSKHNQQLQITLSLFIWQL